VHVSSMKASIRFRISSADSDSALNEGVKSVLNLRGAM
jgi:hypothetical protein